MINFLLKFVPSVCLVEIESLTAVLSWRSLFLLFRKHHRHFGDHVFLSADDFALTEFDENITGINAELLGRFVPEIERMLIDPPPVRLRRLRG